MISAKHIINNVEYIVRARNKSELDKAVQFLYECSEWEMAQLEQQLNKDFDQVLQDIDEGKLVLPSRVDAPEQEVQAEPALPKVVQSTEKQTPPLKKAPAKSKTAGKTMAKPVDNKTVDLGKIGKGK